MTGFLMCVGVELCFAAQLGFSPEHPIRVPMLQAAPRIDGHLEDWKDRAFSNGSWDIHRLRYTPWYDPQRNRLTDHGDEPRPEDDLRARYYLAWDARYFYFGAEVTDNVNDVDDPAHEDKRWYYKDCICWFLEGPRDQRSEHFGQGDNAFCFVIDRRRPKYAAWWRHGAPGRQYIEEPIPPSSVDYTLGVEEKLISFWKHVLKWHLHSVAAIPHGRCHGQVTSTDLKSYTPTRMVEITVGISLFMEPVTTMLPGPG